MHRISGYLIILVCHFQMYTGMVAYGSRRKGNFQIIIYLGLIIVHYCIYATLLFTLEVTYRIRYHLSHSDYLKFKNKTAGTMSMNDFKQYVQNGASYVLFDGYVIDVESFIGEHPGGSSMLSHNIGRDIGKYFHGAYSLLGSMPRHSHSKYALEIMTRLKIAKIFISNLE